MTSSVVVMVGTAAIIDEICMKLPTNWVVIELFDEIWFVLIMLDKPVKMALALFVTGRIPALYKLFLAHILNGDMFEFPRRGLFDKSHWLVN